MKKIMIMCDEATMISDKVQYKEASFFEKFKLGLHILMCKSCKVYTEQNKIITTVIEDKFKEKQPTIPPLSEMEKSSIQKKITENL